MLAAGICYRDNQDNQDDEDIKLLDTINNTIESVSPSVFERRYPSYIPYHHTTKAAVFAQLGIPGVVSLPQGKYIT